MTSPARFAVFLALGLLSSSAAAQSSCVACHESASGVAYLEHDFADWKASPHAKAGISCESCHGGDPAKKDKREAHQAVLPSGDPKSRVYFTSVPRLCGTCHAAEEDAFRKSRHARELALTGRGPNCVTCHGSMANHVLAPRELELTCTLCHRKPTRAYATLLSLGTASRALQKLDLEVARAAKLGVDAAQQESAQAKARSVYQGALIDWHTFRMEPVLKASQEAARQAALASRELELKEKQHGQ